MQSVKEISILPEDLNSLGTVFGGKWLSWSDGFASLTARKAFKEPPTLVTVNLHSRFLAPGYLGNIVKFVGEVCHITRTTLTVHVMATEHFSRKNLFECYATQVYIVDGKPSPIENLIPFEIDQESPRWKIAEKLKGFWNYASSSI